MSYILIHVFFLCMNIGLATVTSVTGVDLGAVDLPDNKELVDNISGPKDSKGGVLDFLIEGVEQAGAAAKIMFDALTGGFVLNVINNSIFELPSQFKLGLQSLLLFLLAVQLYYFLSGRFMSKLS